jgi:hypothetical protein
VLQSELVRNTSAAAGLEPALTSLVKRTVQLTKTAVALQAQRLESEAAAATPQHCAAATAAAACFPAAVVYLVAEHLKGFAEALQTMV